MKFKIYHLLHILVTLMSFASCKNEEMDDYMNWEVVSVSDPDDLMVVIQNNTNNTLPNSSAIYVIANYSDGDIVMKCTNHNINYTLLGSNGSYTNAEMGFSLIPIDQNTLKIHFDPNASGIPEMSVQITLTNSDGKSVCNTFLFIDRRFGEIQPND